MTQQQEDPTSIFSLKSEHKYSKEVFSDPCVELEGGLATNYALLCFLPLTKK